MFNTLLCMAFRFVSDPCVCPACVQVQLMEVYKRVERMTKDYEKEAQIEKLKAIVPSAHVDSIWPSEPPKSGPTAALGTLKGGQHWCVNKKYLITG